MGKSLIINGADFSENGISDITRYGIVYNLTNIDTANSTLPTAIKQGGTTTIKFAVAVGYGFPLSVSVTGASSSYNATTGVLKLSSATGVVTVTATGVIDESPAIIASQQSLSFNGVYGEPAVELELLVMGSYLTNPISVAISGTGASCFSSSVNSISIADATQGKTIKITYNPQNAGNHTASLVLSSTGAADVTVALVGIAKQKVDITSLFTTWNENSCYYIAAGQSVPSPSNSTVFETSNAVDISSYVGKRLVFTFLDYQPGSGGTATISSVFLDSNGNVVGYVMVGNSGQAGVGIGKTAEVVIPAGASSFIATYPNATKRTQFNMPEFSAYVEV